MKMIIKKEDITKDIEIEINDNYLVGIDDNFSLVFKDGQLKIGIKDCHIIRSNIIENIEFTEEFLKDFDGTAVFAPKIPRKGGEDITSKLHKDFKEKVGGK